MIFQETQADMQNLKLKEEETKCENNKRLLNLCLLLFSAVHCLAQFFICKHSHIVHEIKGLTPVRKNSHIVILLSILDLFFLTTISSSAFKLGHPFSFA